MWGANLQWSNSLGAISSAWSLFRVSSSANEANIKFSASLKFFPFSIVCPFSLTHPSALLHSTLTHTHTHAHAQPYRCTHTQSLSLTHSHTLTGCLTPAHSPNFILSLFPCLHTSQLYSKLLLLFSYFLPSKSSGSFRKSNHVFASLPPRHFSRQAITVQQLASHDCFNGNVG